MSDQQPFFGSSWKLRDNQIVRVNQQSLGEISPDEIKKIKHDIVFDPSALLEKSQDLFWKYISEDINLRVEYLQNRLSENNLVALINNGICLENRGNSLGMLRECQSYYCSLSRWNDKSQAGKQFEYKVIGELENQLDRENKEDGVVTLVDVGSGDLFSDLVLITKLFEKNKKPLHLNCVFIDSEYKDYIKAMNNINKNRKIEKFYFVENNIQKMNAYRTCAVEINIQKKHAWFVQLSQ